MADTTNFGLPEGFTLDKAKATKKPVTAADLTLDKNRPGVGAKIAQRFLGTDVEDPIPWTRLGSTVTGLLAGASIGARAGSLGFAGGPVVGGMTTAAGTAIGGLAGAFVGAPTPEALMEAGEKLGVFEPGTRDLHGLNPRDLRTVVEGELLLELVTQGGIGAARLAGRGITNVITGANRQTRELAEEAAKRDVHLLPVMVGNRKIARGFISTLGRFPYVGGPISRFAAEADVASAKAFSELPPRIAIVASADEVSQEIFTEVPELMKTVGNQFDARYKAVFDAADAQRITLRPQATVTRAQEILAEIKKSSPRAAKGKPAPEIPKPISELRGFIQRSAMRMVSDTGDFTPQSLHQLDNVLQGIDTKIAQITSSREGSKGANGLALTYLASMRTALISDMMNVGKGKIGPGGKPPRDIGRDLRAIDKDFTNTMADIAETSAASRFGSMRRFGLRSAQFRATRQSPDNLVDVLMRGDSPQIVEEVAAMLGAAPGKKTGRVLGRRPDLFRKMSASILARRMESATKNLPNGMTEFSPEAFAKSMGMDSRLSGRFMATKKLLELSGGLTVRELDKMLEISRAIGSVEIPDWSSFVARRAVIGGARTASAVLIPGLAFAGSSMGRSGQGMIRTVIGGAMAIGGARLFSHMISNPDSARALRYVLKEETSRVEKRRRGIYATRAAIWGLMEAGAITRDQFEGMLEVTNTFYDEVKAQDSVYDDIRALPVDRQ